jgi:hypothetical protein
MDSVRLITLETTEGSLIKDITKVIPFQDIYYIFDVSLLSVFAFRSNGDFLFKIDNKGNGPQEYIHLSDIMLDSINKELVLLDPLGGRMHHYTLGGRFKHRTKLPSVNGAYGTGVILNRDTIAFATHDEKNALKYYSKTKGSFVYETMPHPYNAFDAIFYIPLPYFNFYANSSVMNEIYAVTGNGLHKAYKWDFGALNNSRKQIEEGAKLSSIIKDIHDFEERISRVLSSEYVNYIFLLHGGNESYKYAQIIRENTPVHIFHHISTNTNLVFDTTIEGAYFLPMCWTNSYMIGYADALSLTSYIKNKLNFTPDAILDSTDRRKKRERTEDDNPMLIKYYFKKL